MFKIYGDRARFYQWDLNQKLIVENETVKEVHFSNAATGAALVCEVYELDGVRVANVPNVLLQSAFDIKAFGFCGECVRASASFEVASRAKPQDYTYTETEVKRYEELEARITELEASGGGGGGCDCEPPEMIVGSSRGMEDGSVNVPLPFKSKLYLGKDDRLVYVEREYTDDYYNPPEVFTEKSYLYDSANYPNLDLVCADNLDEWEKLEVCANIGAVTQDDLASFSEEIIDDIESLYIDFHDVLDIAEGLENWSNEHIRDFTYEVNRIDILEAQVGDIQEVLNNIKARQETYINGGAN